MLKYNDIKDAITLKINTKFPNIEIYEEELQQGFEEPAFFVQLIPINNIRKSKNIRNRLLLVDIQYFPKGSSREEAFNVADTLEQIFIDYIRVKDRALKVDNVGYTVKYDGIGIILHFQITIDYFEAIPKQQDNLETINEIVLKKGV
ncbi:phage tail terminator family protein [Clostridium botulinum]|uniref:phage tail terminator family protein n=1 Tax=Clostridium botulinum TaxID=1491 RepID=UPI00249EA008|nr:hypothetical protein [Clostridium botulinum]MDU4596445.1 hypothetical protein [Clostridium sporogenes]WGZ48082.1 hypothetical protein HEQ52_18210 [Clostridium botulinum]